MWTETHSKNAITAAPNSLLCSSDIRQTTFLMQKAKTTLPCQSFPSRRNHLVRSQPWSTLAFGWDLWRSQLFSSLFSNCSNWPFPTLPSIYSFKDLWGRGDCVANHNTWWHQVDIYESAKKFIMFFQTIKNTNWKPSCSHGKERNGNTKWSQTVPPPSKKNRKYGLETATVLFSSQEGWRWREFLWPGINPSPLGQEDRPKCWLSWCNSGVQQTLLL